MDKWIVVWVDSSTSYLCKRYSDHYEVEATATNAGQLKKIADELNRVVTS